MNNAEREIDCDEYDKKFLTLFELKQHHIDEDEFTSQYDEYTFRTTNAAPAKRSASNTDIDVVVEMDVCPEETPQPPKLLGNIILPSPLCSKVVLPSEPTALCFAWHTSSEPGDLRVMKHVTISACTEATAAQENSFLCTVFCRGIKTDELPVNNECDAAEALKKADELKLCPGCGIEPVTSGQCMKFGAAHFAKNCLVTSPDGKPCLRCKYTRKLVQNHMYRLKKKRSTNFNNSEGLRQRRTPREVDEEGNEAQPEQQQRRTKPALGRRNNEAGPSPAASDSTAFNAGYPREPDVILASFTRSGELIHSARAVGSGVTPPCLETATALAPAQPDASNVSAPLDAASAPTWTTSKEATHLLHTTRAVLQKSKQLAALPAGPIRVVFRARDGLSLKKHPAARLLQALRTTVDGSTLGELHTRIHSTNNTFTVVTAEEATALALVKVQAIALNGKQCPIAAYIPAPPHPCRNQGCDFKGLLK
ncbi:hypothetical protein MRX96_040566 [Rhipicephalus microplus]